MTDASNEWGEQVMTANIHPTSGDLVTAVTEPDRAAATLGHTEGCVACRVRLLRLRRDLGFEPLEDDSLERILAASTPLPGGLGALVLAERQGDPQSGEIWRIGSAEALLVWVRRVFDDGVADVIPLVLDVELADQETVLVGADATPLASELAAMTALRTHVHFGAFLNRIGYLDIGKEVNEVMTAVVEGRRPSGVRVGPPIDDDDDRRIEYRQALRDLLADFAPSVWAEAHPEHIEESTESVKSRLGERIGGLDIRDAAAKVVVTSEGVRVSTLMKITCLTTAVLVVTLDDAFPELADLVEACEELADQEIDSDAVAVTVPGDGWDTVLFTRAHLRSAIGLPNGALTGPTVTLDGHNLVEILVKFFDGITNLWDVTEPIADQLKQRNVHQMATKHAKSALEQVSQAGARAHQGPKKQAWQALPAELCGQVARFVEAIVGDEPVDEALRELGLGELP
jgi:hypothetical protein